MKPQHVAAQCYVAGGDVAIDSDCKRAKWLRMARIHGTETTLIGWSC